MAYNVPGLADSGDSHTLTTINIPKTQEDKTPIKKRKYIP